MQGQLFQVRLPGRPAFGVVVDEGIVTEAAPPAAGFVGQTYEKLEFWVRGQRGMILATGWPPTFHDTSALPRKTAEQSPAARPEDQWFGSGPGGRGRKRRGR